VAHQSADHLLYGSAVEDVNIKVIPLVEKSWLTSRSPRLSWDSWGRLQGQWYRGHDLVS